MPYSQRLDSQSHSSFDYGKPQLHSYQFVLIRSFRNCTSNHKNHWQNFLHFVVRNYKCNHNERYLKNISLYVAVLLMLNFTPTFAYLNLKESAPKPRRHENRILYLILRVFLRVINLWCSTDGIPTLLDTCTCLVHSWCL